MYIRCRVKKSTGADMPQRYLAHGKPTDNGMIKVFAVCKISLINWNQNLIFKMSSSE